MQDSALKRGLVRLGWLTAAALVNTFIVWLTEDYANLAWYPLVYYVLTIVRDVIDKNLPNLPTKE